MSRIVTHTFHKHKVRFDTEVVSATLPASILEKDQYETERQSLSKLLDELKPDDVFYDVGAMFGIYTTFAANELTNGTIVAFEPYPPNIDALERTLEINDLSNVRICECALGDTDGSESFESPSMAYHDALFEKLSNEAEASAASAGREALPRNNPPAVEGDNVGAPLVSEDPAVTFTAETRRGDDLVQAGESPQPNVVKIDVEGAEGDVIEGMTETLEQDACRYLVCELHPCSGDDNRACLENFGWTVGEIVTKVEALGFQTSCFEGGDYIHLRGQK